MFSPDHIWLSFPCMPVSQFMGLSCHLQWTLSIISLAFFSMNFLFLNVAALGIDWITQDPRWEKSDPFPLRARERQTHPSGSLWECVTLKWKT